MAADHSVGLGRWRAETDRLFDRVAGRFARVETRRRARKFLSGLLAELPRKNCWSIAEHAGDTDPHGMQHLLGRAVPRCRTGWLRVLRPADAVHRGHPDMRIAKADILGAVLPVLAYTGEEEAIRIANDSEYGLSGAMQSSHPEAGGAMLALADQDLSVLLALARGGRGSGSAG